MACLGVIANRVVLGGRARFGQHRSLLPVTHSWEQSLRRQNGTGRHSSNQGSSCSCGALSILGKIQRSRVLAVEDTAAVSTVKKVPLDTDPVTPGCS